jgi:hypothetical protein
MNRKWLASDYTDSGAFGILDYENHIIIRSCHGIPWDELKDIASAHNAHIDTLEEIIKDLREELASAQENVRSMP